MRMLGGCLIPNPFFADLQPDAVGGHRRRGGQPAHARGARVLHRGAAARAGMIAPLHMLLYTPATICSSLQLLCRLR